MARVDIRRLSLAIDREASLFERESDVSVFLRRAAGMVVRAGQAKLCAIYVLERTRDALLLRATAGAGGDLPDEAGPGHPIHGAVRERRVTQLANRGGSTRFVYPITRGPDRIGALVIDRRGPVELADEAELRGIAARLGSVLESASVLLETRPEGAAPGGLVIHGETASAGVAEGRALLFDAVTEVTGTPGPVEDGAAAAPGGSGAVRRFNDALELTRRQIEELVGDTTSQLADVVELIFSAHLLMLHDDAFTGAMRRLVQGGRSPEAAVREVVSHYAHIFDAMSETRLAEKGQDVRDIGYRLLRNLSGRAGEQSDYRGRIVLAGHVYPSDLVRLAAQRADGVVLLGAAVTAHVAILARSLSLPALITHDRSILDIAPGTPLVLDATAARLYVDPPSPPALAPAARAPRDEGGPAAVGPIPTTTRDGVRIRVLANVNLFKDARMAASLGAEGIGLYRSEFLFIIRNDFLNEEEQLVTYRRIVDALPGCEVSLRTADIGGDKLMQGREEQESNPFLGVRGIRFSLANRVLFREQLRAMLRAGVDRDLGILLPMVSSLEEIEEARAEVELCRRELETQGVPHNPNPRVGAMVELPSAVMVIEDLAGATDFLSIGTNDLIMYLLAVDRTNERLSRLYRSHHPTVLRSLAQVARGMGAKIASLSVCGDSAADPLMIPFLLGIGVRRLSAAPERLADLRASAGTLSIAECERVAGEMLAIRTARDMDAYLHGLRARMNGSDGRASAAPGAPA
jgi:phosphotransferase system enzyme I (PtsP)